MMIRDLGLLSWPPCIAFFRYPMTSSIVYYMDYWDSTIRYLVQVKF